MSFDQIELNLSNIKENVRKICLESGRDPSKVNILAVSKGQTLDAIREAYQVGHNNFGENYVQEAKEKIDHVSKANWHFIGAIQSKKTKEIAKNFDWVHSVDSEKLARKLSEHRDPKRGKLKIFMQVNTSEEQQKRGVPPNEVYALAEKISLFSNISLVGLMTISAKNQGKIPAARCFQNLRKISEQLNSHLGLREGLHLSMGMSNDYVSAIKEGSTWVRLGTLIFGGRDKHL